MKKRTAFIILPIALVVLSACRPRVGFEAKPGAVACPGDTVSLTWNGADDGGAVTISASPPVSGLPLTGASDGSASVGISETTSFTAAQPGIDSGGARVEVPHPPVTVPVTFSVLPVCPPGGTPYWPLSAEAAELMSPQAIVGMVSNPSFPVLATHSGITAPLRPGESSHLFDGTSATGDWIFRRETPFVGTCPREGSTGPGPGGGIDPGDLEALSVTVDATCP